MDDSEGLWDDTMSAAQIKVWHKCFKDGHQSVESDSRAGRPATNRAPANAEHAQAAANRDGRLLVRELKLTCVF